MNWALIMRDEYSPHSEDNGIICFDVLSSRASRGHRTDCFPSPRRLQGWLSFKGGKRKKEVEKAFAIVIVSLCLRSIILDNAEEEEGFRFSGATAEGITLFSCLFGLSEVGNSRKKCQRKSRPIFFYSTIQPTNSKSTAVLRISFT